MGYRPTRVALERYEQELTQLLDVVTQDAGGDVAVAHHIVFSVTRERWNLSPSELLRRGLVLEAYDAARRNFSALRSTEPERLAREARALHGRSGSRSSA